MRLTVVGHTTGGTTTQTDVCEGGAAVLDEETSSAVGGNLTSNSASDASAGTGLRTVKIIGLDANYQPAYEVVTLNGVANVALVGTFLKVNEVIGLSFGNTGAAVGTVTFKNSGGSKTYATIAPQKTTARNGKFTAPDGRPAFIHGIEWSAYSTGNCELMLLANFNPATGESLGEGVYIDIASVSLKTSLFRQEFRRPIRVPGRGTVKLACICSASSQVITGTMDIECRGYNTKSGAPASTDEANS